MLSYSDLKKGVTFVWNGKPCEVIEANFSRMQQRKAVVQAKIRDLTSGKIIETSFQASDQFLSAEIERRALLFLYTHRGEYVFADPANQKDRFVLKGDAIGQQKTWLKSNTTITAFFFKGQLLTFTLPIKMDLKVTEAPPGIRGDRAQGGTKAITLETGAVIQAPLFINTGDIVRVNTETGEYAERVEKA
jgi:elongation factor P